MNDDEVNLLIDKSHFKTFQHVRAIIPAEISDAELKRILSKRVKNYFVKPKKIKPLMIKIFSRSYNCWFHDFMENVKGFKPQYFHIFIGMNNRFGVAIPIQNKTEKTIFNSLTKFLNEHKCVKLTSDEEPAFLSPSVLNMLKSKQILVQTVLPGTHSALGIIDRFIRTLRDMNTPSESCINQSDHPEFRNITEERMQELIEAYNNTYHTSIKCSPREMYDNPDLEEEYIVNMLKQRERQRKSVKNLELNVGDWVRYILPKADGKTKKRYQHSREMYQIGLKNGNMYTLIAADGTTLHKPRFMLRLCNDEEIKRMKFAGTTGDATSGIIQEVAEDQSGVPKGKVRVLFKMPTLKDGTVQEAYVDVVPKTNERSRFNLTGI
jgi:predicted RNA-binding protein Jag